MDTEQETTQQPPDFNVFVAEVLRILDLRDLDPTKYHFLSFFLELIYCKGMEDGRKNLNEQALDGHSKIYK